MKKIISMFIALTVMSLAVKLVSFASVYDLSAKSAVLIDSQTGTVIYAKNEKEKLPMASTTKIMTTLITLESGDIDDEFVIDSRALLTEGSSMYLREGDVVSKRELCYGMMLPSGNDAANAAALKIGGEYSSFAEKMNRRAYDIGMFDSNFVTPSGLHDDFHYSTAYDMALLAREAMKNDDFRTICGTQYMKLSDERWECDKYLTNSNKLLSRYDGCTGIKTGFTDEAGRCLVSSAVRNGVELIAVTLNAPDDWNDHIKMMEYGFKVASSERYEDCTTEFDVSVVGGLCDSVRCVISKQPEITAVNGKQPQITEKIFMPDFKYAPIMKGDVIGYIEYCSEDDVMCSVNVVADENCGYNEKTEEKSLYRFIIEKLKELFV